jgi:hypothetical protein
MIKTEFEELLKFVAPNIAKRNASYRVYFASSVVI